MSSGLACTSSATSSRALLDVDLDRVGVVGQVAGDVLGDGEGAGTDDAVALGADFVLDESSSSYVVVEVVDVVVGVVVLVAHASLASCLGGGVLGGGRLGRGRVLGLSRRAPLGRGLGGGSGSAAGAFGLLRLLHRAASPCR